MLQRVSTHFAKWASGVLAALFVLGVIGYGLVQQSGFSQSANHRSADYSENADARLEQACVAVAESGKLVCIRKAATEHRLQARDKQREYDDLAAQQTSALWTSIMGVAALIGIGLSAVGFALVYVTFRETQRTAHIAQDNLDAYKQAERARLITTVNPPFVSGDGMIFGLKIDNIGRSSAVLSMIEWGIFSHRAFPDRTRTDTLVRQLPLDDFFDSFDNNLKVILPNSLLEFPMKIGLGEGSMRSGFIIGRICYDAIEPRSHIDYFCYGFSPVIGANPFTGPFKINDLMAKHDHPKGQ